MTIPVAAACYLTGYGWMTVQPGAALTAAGVSPQVLTAVPARAVAQPDAHSAAALVPGVARQAVLPDAATLAAVWRRCETMICPSLLAGQAYYADCSHGFD